LKGDLTPGIAIQISGFLTFIYRAEASSEETKPVTLQQGLDIPRKAKKSRITSSEDNSITNGMSGPGKRKRDGEDEEMTNGHVAKKVAADQANGDGEDVIVLDEEDGGAILID
jgi:ubiquitin-like 1-activating enzyme E1 B